MHYRKSKVVLNYLDDKPQVYKIQQINFPTISFKQLVRECSTACGVNSNQTKSVIDALVNRIVHYMEIGHSVNMGEFGTFKPTFHCKIAKKIDEADATTVKNKVIRFFPGKEFRDMLNAMSIDNASPSLDIQE